MNRIYTKTGDKGTSSFFDGGREKKSNIRFKVYGEIDHLSVIIGECYELVNDSEIKSVLDGIQNDLFAISSIMATRDVGKLPDWCVRIDWASKVEDFEVLIDNFWNKMPELNNFILPRGSMSSLKLHEARVLTRSVERLMVDLADLVEFNVAILQYINRLSDLFFCFARWVNFDEGIDETLWVGGDGEEG